MSSNSFKKLEEQEAQRYANSPPEIKRNVASSMNTIKTVGSIIELYIGRALEVLILMTGGDQESNGSKNGQKKSGLKDEKFF